MNKYQKEIFQIKAKITKQVILNNWEQIQKDDAKIVIEVLKKEKKKTEIIFQEILGDELIELIEFRIRKRTKDEKKIIFFASIIPILFVYCLVMLVLNAFEMVEKHYIYFGNYLMAVIGFLFALGIVKNGFREKNLKFLFIGLALSLLNGGLLVFNLSNMY